MKGIEVSLAELTAADWSQASKDAKYLGSLFRRMAVFEAIAGEGKELRSAVDALTAEKERLTAEIAALAARLADDTAAREARIAEATAQAVAIVAEAEAMRSEANAMLAGLQADDNEWRQKVARKKIEFTEADQQLRRTREQISQITKAAQV